VNTSFVTDVRRSFQSKLASTFRSERTRLAPQELVLRCCKGLALSLAIGVAGSVAASIAVPQDPASAATIALRPKAGHTVKAVKAGGHGASRSSKTVNGRVNVSPDLVKLAAKAVKSTKSQPKSQPKSEPVKVAASKGYKVRAGDSLSSIAGSKNITVAALAQTNKLKPNATLRIGQSLSLPKVELHGPKSLPTRLRANPKRLAVRKHTAKWAKANDIPQDLLEATLWQESGFDQSKVSSTGAIGVGQIMPDTAGFIEKELIGVDLNPRITENNVRMSARYLRYLLKANHSNTTKALHAYYQGMGSIQDNGLYDDTIKYARNVQALRRHFKD
jgi:soluble lytic murein transglycosylase-like protein